MRHNLINFITIFFLYCLKNEIVFKRYLSIFQEINNLITTGGCTMERQHLTKEEMLRAVGMLEADTIQSNAADATGTSQSDI